MYKQNTSTFQLCFLIRGLGGAQLCVVCFCGPDIHAPCFHVALWGAVYSREARIGKADTWPLALELMAFPSLAILT